MEKRSSVIARFGQVILSPWATAAALVLAVCLGLWLPHVALALKPVGGVYLALLQMCSLPLVICGVVSSIGRILRDGESKHYLGRLVLVVAGGLFITAALAVVLGLAVRPGSGLGTEASQTLGRLLSESEVQGGIVTVEHKPISFVDFLASAVPRNIFSALSQGSQLPILFFSLVLGVALGFTSSLKSQQTIEFFEATFDALIKLIEWLLYLLPIGLISLLAPQIAEAGFGIFVAMLKLIVLVNVAALISLLVGNFIIARRTGRPYFAVLRQLLDCLLIAFATKSSFAAIPSALSAMQRLGMSKNTTDLVIPLSVSLNPIGNVHYYTLGAIFIAQLYGVSFPASSLVILLVGGVMAAVAGSALPSAAAIGVISILLEPLGLPVGAAVILIMAIDPFIDPATTALNVHGSCVAASLVADRSTGMSMPPFATKTTSANT
jgi:proton glutamate symport protein